MELVDWLDAGAGALKDPDIIDALKEEAARRGYFSRKELGLGPIMPSLEEASSNLG